MLAMIWIILAAGIPILAELYIEFDGPIRTENLTLGELSIKFHNIWISLPLLVFLIFDLIVNICMRSKASYTSSKWFWGLTIPATVFYLVGVVSRYIFEIGDDMLICLFLFSVWLLLVMRACDYIFFTKQAVYNNIDNKKFLNSNSISRPI